MTEFREILVLGLGRSGSNLLSSILRKLDGNAGFFEIFFDGKAQGLEHYPAILTRLGEALGTGPAKPDDPVFLKVRNDDPVAYFEALSQAARAEGHVSMSCKIFARHISIPVLETLLRRPNLSVIFLTRSRIHRYISELKGSITRAYVREDTTGLRPVLSVPTFLKAAFRQDRDLDAMLNAVVASGVKVARLGYEDDLDLDETLRIDRVALALQAIGHGASFKTTRTEAWVVKQDSNAVWRDKIENGFEAAAALSGLGLLDYAEAPPLAELGQSPRAPVAEVIAPRDAALLDEGGYNFVFAHDPAITFTAIQYGRSFFAEWLAGPDRALAQHRGVHFLKPTWTMETTDLKPLAASLRLAEGCNPGHHFVALHVSDREARKYREVGIRSIPGNPNLFNDERHFAEDVAPHPGMPQSDAIYVARLAPWKNHELASALVAPLFVYGAPVDPSESAQFDRLRQLCPTAHFVNHTLDQGRYHYLGRQELASVMSRAGVGLALSQEEGCMRASGEYLMAGLPVVSVPSIGGRDLLFTTDTALIVDSTPEAVRNGVAQMLARNLSREEVRRATLSRVQDERRRFCDAANRIVASLIGPLARRISSEPLLDFTIRYVPLRRMIEALQ